MPVKKIFSKIEMNLFSFKIWYLVQMKVIYELKKCLKKNNNNNLLNNKFNKKRNINTKKKKIGIRK